jgi:hypothetical protein
MTRKQKKEQITKIFQETSYIDDWFDFKDYIDKAIDNQDISVFEDGIDELFNYYLILYNRNAMNFLSKEDPSLIEAFKYAKEKGYTLDNLDSEKLANLLLEARIRDEWADIKSQIEYILIQDCDDCDDNE